MNAGALALVEFKDRTHLDEVASRLTQLEQVSFWHAVDGQYQLVIKLDHVDGKTPKTLESLPGSLNVTICTLIEPLKNLECEAAKACSYLFIETQPHRQEDVRAALEGHPEVVFCAPVDGAFNLIGMIQESSFDRVDRFVKNIVPPLEGILRFKQSRIIALDRM